MSAHFDNRSIFYFAQWWLHLDSVSYIQFIVIPI